MQKPGISITDRYDRDAFWREQAGRVHWETPFESVLDFSRPPFAKWFVGGKTISVTTPSTDGCPRRRKIRR